MPRRSFFFGLALIAGSTVTLEIVLTRVFSVIMWYHMSLVAVSMAMFGMTLGALLVHWRPTSFTVEKAALACSRHAAWFGLSTVVTLLVCINTPFRIDATAKGITLNAVFLVTYWISVAAVPFVFSGICVCVALTRFPSQVGKLYAMDLAGASAACLAVVWLLNHVDALSAILLVGAVGLVASTVFALGTAGKRAIAVPAVLAAAVGAFALSNTSSHAIKVQYADDRYIGSETVRYEAWNAFSYVRLTPVMQKRGFQGEGTRHMDRNTPAESMNITMDARAMTPMVRFDGDWEKVDWLFYDATNLAHAIRSDGPVLVIGAGGGRDVLSAMLAARGNRQVVGVEINPNTFKLLTEIETSFTGNLARLPGVSLYNDEARSWVARSTQRFQVITIPLVDTSAASAAGAYALTENSLYTLEAFELFFDHLQDDGVLSVSRWWAADIVNETHRLVALTSAALRRKGITDPRQHILVDLAGNGLTTMLMSRRPFSPADLAGIAASNEKHGFTSLLTPLAGEANLVAAAADPSWPSRPELAFANLEPTTDDKPFFFHSYRMSNLFKGESALGVAKWDKDAMVILLALVFFVTVLAVGVIGVPYWLERRKEQSAPETPSVMGFFASIGFGFMLFEGAQLQRLNIFLGYPLYALTVVLFGLLVSSSLGAFLAGRLFDRSGPAAIRPVAFALLLVVGTIGLVSMPVIRGFMHATTPVRIVIATLLVAPAGLCLGMLFPMGLRLSERIKDVSLPWCWAINGMASTCAAVYGIAISISFGFTATYWTCLACYVVASFLATRLAARPFSGAVAITAEVAA